MVEALRAEPTVLVVEDVHWADEATLDWLALWAAAWPTCRCSCVLTFRDDDPEPMTRIAKVLAVLPRRVVVRLPLPLLSPEAVAVIAGRGAPRGVRAHRRQPVAGHRAARGGGGGAALHPGVGAGRLAAAPPASRPAIEVVALVPGVCEWWLVEGVAAGGLDAVEAAMRTGLLVADDAGVRFRHELTRRVVEDALFVPRRRDLHRRILAVLERRAGEPRGVGPVARASPTTPGSRATRVRSSATPWPREACRGRRPPHREAAAQLGAALEHAGLLDEPSAPRSWRSSPWRPT